MKNKICILSSSHPALDQRVFYKQARALAQSGDHVVLIAQHDKDETVDGVRIISLTQAHNRFQRMVVLAFQVLYIALKEKAEVYHFHDAELIPVGFVLKIFTKAKVIYDVHESYPHDILAKPWIPWFLRKIVSFAMENIEKLAGRSFDAVITATEPITKRFSASKSRRVITLYNFPVLGLLSVPQEIPITNREFDIIHVGSLSPPRLSFMFSVGFELKQRGYHFKWCLLGVSPEVNQWVEKTLNHDDINMRDNFVFVGKVPYIKVANYLQKSKMGINHHPAETRFLVSIPVKIFEYMICGLPVVSSALPIIKQLLGGKGCAILTEPGDINQFVEAIAFLLDHPQEAIKMGRIGKKLVEIEYNWSREESKLLVLYAELLNEGTEENA